MEVFTTFFVILLAGMALPIVLLISGVLFDLFFVIYVVVETMVSRKRKPRTSGAVARYSGVRQIGWAG
jgi:magnesium-transporting ATPase (P-type)